MTSKWNYCPLTSDEQEVESGLAKRYAGVPPISELLVQRGISSVEEAEKFLVGEEFFQPNIDAALEMAKKL